MKLSDMAIKKAKPEAKPYKMTDGAGLYLLVEPKGSKYWRMFYRFAGKQKTLAIGVYPDVSLADARVRCHEARKLLANNVDPSAAKQAQKEATFTQTDNNFEVIAREWFTRFASGYVGRNDIGTERKRLSDRQASSRTRLESSC